VALTAFQSEICKSLAEERKALGQSYVAGGAALNLLCQSPRISHDLDLFHDTKDALTQTYQHDTQLLIEKGYHVEIIREYATFFEALIKSSKESTLLQWVIDSAYRFYPLIEHDELGLTLSPFDLATNKTLALVGRLEVRDWIDIMTCHDQIQPLGYLLWAACGKDEGYNPEMILSEAKRSSRYRQAELDTLEFSSPPPTIQQLSLKWKHILSEAEETLALLPIEKLGMAVLYSSGSHYKGLPLELADDLRNNLVSFHSGCIQGCLPTIP
jgi:hypothetical protein